jgi:hypothetical protein
MTYYGFYEYRACRACTFVPWQRRKKGKMVFRGLPRACWEFSFLMGKNMCFDTKVE